jgi:glycogen synthase
LRIALISYEFPPDTGKGGIGTYNVQLASLLIAKGFDVHVFAGTAKPSYKEVLQHVNIHRVNCKDPFDFRTNVVTVFSLEQQIKDFEIIESPEIHGNAWEIKKAFPQIPLIVRLHAPNYLVEHLKKKYISVLVKLRYVIGALRRGKLDLGYWRKYDYLNDTDFQFTKIADAITAPSETMKQWAIKHWHISPKDIIVIANPFLPTMALLEIPINERVGKNEIVFFGRLNVLKGLVNGTLAMKKILVEFPNYHFKVIGDDGPGPNAGQSMREWMQKKLKKVIDNVSFYDGQEYEKLPAHISNSTIALLPSLFESFSYSCAEAMAAGKAVVGSSGTGMEDIIVNNYSGLLVNAENKKDIYFALKKLIKNDGLRYSISKSAKKNISTSFNADVLAHQYINYYKSVTALHG